jgi:putative intracellular protease/amidase
VADGKLVTGQNPASAAGVAEKMVELLKNEN